MIENLWRIDDASTAPHHEQVRHFSQMLVRNTDHRIVERRPSR
jgi:hypothetical protein